MTAALIAAALTGVAMLFGARTGQADWKAVLGLLVIFFGRFRSGFAIGTSN